MAILAIYDPTICPFFRNPICIFQDKIPSVLLFFWTPLAIFYFYFCIGLLQNLKWNSPQLSLTLSFDMKGEEFCMGCFDPNWLFVDRSMMNLILICGFKVVVTQKVLCFQCIWLVQWDFWICIEGGAWM